MEKFSSDTEKLGSPIPTLFLASKISKSERATVTGRSKTAIHRTTIINLKALAVCRNAGFLLSYVSIFNFSFLLVSAAGLVVAVEGFEGAKLVGVS